MRSLFILLSVTVISVFVAPYSSAAVNGEPSSVSKKNKALPSNYYQTKENIDTSQEDFISSVVQHLPIHKPQYSEDLQEKDDDDDDDDLSAPPPPPPPPYKNLEPKRYTVIVPALPEEQTELNEKKYIAVEATKDRRYKKLMELINQVKQQVNIPDGVRQKQVVGTDLNGRLRYIEIPYYNRGSI
ncbi:hypothetical protein BD770DRAFT_475116 [Pilaira anomala]|nr:hypothetical protein BD770DRAFT_475116 [Pilaira anomala]